MSDDKNDPAKRPSRLRTLLTRKLGEGTDSEAEQRARAERAVVEGMTRCEDCQRYHTPLSPAMFDRVLEHSLATKRMLPVSCDQLADFVQAMRFVPELGLGIILLPIIDEDGRQLLAVEFGPPLERVEDADVKALQDCLHEMRDACVKILDKHTKESNEREAERKAEQIQAPGPNKPTVH